MQIPKIEMIFICPEKGKPMVEVESVNCFAGIGLEGDRYALEKGTYSGVDNRGKPGICMRHVSMISAAAIFMANEIARKNGWEPFSSSETRRNLVISGDGDLLHLIGRKFRFGQALFRGFEECPPCKIPGKIVGKSGFEEAFRQYGGLRAEVLADAELFIGDEFSLV